MGRKRRRPQRQGPTAAEVVAARIESGGSALLDHQAAAERRHEAERGAILDHAREVAASTDRAHAAKISDAAAWLRQAPSGTVQYVARSRKLRKLIDRA